MAVGGFKPPPSTLASDWQCILNHSATRTPRPKLQSGKLLNCFSSPPRFTFYSILFRYPLYYDLTYLISIIKEEHKT